MAQGSHVYDRLAADYDGAMRPLERWLLGRLRASALRELPERARVLEVGVGTGANFQFYTEGARGACVEPSREMLERARVRAKRPPGLWLVRGRAEELPFADDVFDAGLATLVFCSVGSPARAFSELRRVVRPGGRVVLLEHVRPEGLLGYVFDAFSKLTVALCDDHFNRRTAEEARRAGLWVERVEPHWRGVFQIIVCRV
ncbi:MAG TPA: class I SAM-dependent methyltransferase [Pyrinomonadaceae bacterium]